MNAEVAAFVEEYRRATEARDVARVSTTYAVLVPAQRAALSRYFESVEALRVKIDRLQLAAFGEEAVVSYTRTDDFVDARTRRPQRVTVRLTRTLRRVDGRWRFTGL